MNLLKDGKYNELVQMQLPYKHRVGVIKRSEIWAVDPEKKKEAFGGLSEEDVNKFKALIASGINDEDIDIDFDDPKAWDDWYFGRTHRGSGHPWESISRSLSVCFT